MRAHELHDCSLQGTRDKAENVWNKKGWLLTQLLMVGACSATCICKIHEPLMGLEVQIWELRYGNAREEASTSHGIHKSFMGEQGSTQSWGEVGHARSDPYMNIAQVGLWWGRVGWGFTDKCG